MYTVRGTYTYKPNESFEQSPAEAFGFGLVIFPFTLLLCGFVFGIGVVVLEKIRSILPRRVPRRPGKASPAQFLAEKPDPAQKVPPDGGPEGIARRFPG